MVCEKRITSSRARRQARQPEQRHHQQAQQHHQQAQRLRQRAQQAQRLQEQERAQEQEPAQQPREPVPEQRLLLFYHKRSWTLPAGRPGERSISFIFPLQSQIKNPHQKSVRDLEIQPTREILANRQKKTSHGAISASCARACCSKATRHRPQAMACVPHSPSRPRTKAARSSDRFPLASARSNASRASSALPDACKARPSPIHHVPCRGRLARALR